jgi:O-methyltransferase
MDAMHQYVRRVNRAEAEPLAALRRRTSTLPFVATMQGSEIIGQLLQLLIHITGSHRVLEVGVFTGCSTLAIAMALPEDGTVVAIDIDPKWPLVGQDFWRRSECAARIDLRIGAAADVLDGLIGEGLADSFDLAFIDADKDGYEAYLDRALVLLRDNGVLVFDNILFGGHVDAAAKATAITAPRGPRFLTEIHARYAAGLRRFNERIAADERVDLVVLPMLDGVTLARKRPAASSRARAR